jgi:zinc transport system permease protein
MTILLAEFDVPFLERWAQSWFGWYGFELAALLSVVLICALCGMVGALVVGNRMAFFSDAMAHCAFAGVSLGLLIALRMGFTSKSSELQWVLPLIMAGFGALVGVGIAFVRDRTELASDTVIGVFFAGAIGLGAMILQGYEGDKKAFDPERFLFGGPALAEARDLLILAVLLAVTAGLFLWKYNQFVLASFNPSLARSRGVPVALNNYLFIVLLALIVNFSITAVGVLLINALLIVPAATASNWAVNMRQMFRWSFVVSLGTGLCGLYVSRRFTLPLGGREKELGVSGTIICIGVVGFALSMAVPALRRRLAHIRRPPARRLITTP